MNKLIFIIVLVMVMAVAMLLVASCKEGNQEFRDADQVDNQQAQYAKVHPIPYFDHSRERAVYTQIYQARNKSVATHTVWRGDMSIIEGDCPSIGFPIPYDVQLTNPLRTVKGYQSIVAVEQAEPNGMFSSKTTAATWVMCVVMDQGTAKTVPVYVEGRVTAYPYPVVVNYDLNRVTKMPESKPSVVITGGKQP